MTPMVSRLLLSMILLSVTVGSYIVMWHIIYDTSSYDEFATSLIVGAVLYPLLAIGWTLIWLRAVRWTARRIVLTVSLAPVTLIIGALACVALLVAAAGTAFLDENYITLICVPVTLAMWPLGTVFIWQDRAGDRAARVVTAREVRCPKCGYVMADLKTTTCPECGSTYRVGELVAEA